MFSGAQALVIQIISVAAFIGSVWGLVDALRAGAGAFPTAGKQSKTLWVVLLAASAAVTFVTLPYPFGGGGGPFDLLGLAAIVIVLIYFAGVRPAIAPYRGNKGGGKSRNSGGW